jgi:hypothetical protein
MKKIQQEIIETPTIEYTKGILTKRNILLILLLISPFFGYTVYNYKLDFGIILYWVIFVLLVLINVIFPFIKKRYKKTGVILFNRNNIQIEEEYMPINKIEEILFYYYGSKGDLHPGAALGIGILGVQDGADNQVYIKTKEDKEYFFDILLETEANFILLKRRLLEYKMEGVKIKMERLPASKQH